MSKYNLQRYTKTLTLAYATNATTISASTGDLNGLLAGVEINAPDLDSTNTYTVTLTDADSFTIFTRATLAENTKTAIFTDANNHPLRLPLSGTHTITVVTSGAQTGDRTFTVNLLIDRG